MLAMSLLMAKSSRIMAVLKGYVKDNLKIYFDFDSTRAKTLEFVGTGSASFDNTGDYVEWTDGDTKDSLEGIDQLTVVGWARRDGDAGGTFVSKGSYNISGTDWAIEFQGSNNRLRFSVENTFQSWEDPPSGFVDGDGQWIHYAITYDKDMATHKRVNVYYDGVQGYGYDSGTAATVGTNGSPIRIGIGSDDANTFDGRIKGVGIWNRVLSASEIQNIMYKTYTDLKGTEKTNLQFWADLDSDLNAKDNAGDTISGSAGGDSAITTSLYGNNLPRKPRGFDNAPTAQADLIGSGSALFNGSSDYVTAGDSITLTTAGTVVAWSRLSVIGAAEEIISKYDSSASKREWRMGFNTSGNPVMYAMAAAGTYSAATKAQGASTVTVGKWHHIAGTFSTGSTNVQIYLDGVLDGTSSGALANAVDDTDSSVIIGGAENNATVNSFFIGKIAQVGVFNAVLTQEQIQSISQKTYDDLTTSEKTNLVSWWGLDVNFEDEHGSNDGTAA